MCVYNFKEPFGWKFRIPVSLFICLFSLFKCRNIRLLVSTLPHCTKLFFIWQLAFSPIFLAFFLQGSCHFMSQGSAIPLLLTGSVICHMPLLWCSAPVFISYFYDFWLYIYHCIYHFLLFLTVYVPFCISVFLFSWLCVPFPITKFLLFLTVVLFSHILKDITG